MRCICRRQSPYRSQRGSLEVIAAFAVMMLALILSSSLIFTRSSMVVSETVDRIHQGVVDRRAIENITKEALMQKLGVTPVNSSESLDALIDNMLSSMNGGSTGMTLSRAAASPSLSGISHAMFPFSVIPATPAPDLATAGHSLQLKRVLRAGAVTVGSPLVFSFTRAVTAASAENKTINATAQLWSVPLSNWALIAYGLPASGFVPAAAPINASTVLGSPSFRGGGGEGLLLTTLRPSPDYSGGDPTAFSDLYSPPDVGQSESLPSFYRDQVALAWDAWEFIWAGGNWPLTDYNSGAYQDRLLAYALSANQSSGDVRATTATLEMSAFTPTVPAGVSLVGNGATVDLGGYPEDILYIVDGAGSGTVNLVGASDNALGPLVLVISGQGESRTTLNLSGTNNRTVLIYARNSSVVCTTAVTAGGIYLDANSSASGTLTLEGLFAFYGGIPAANPLPSLSLSLTPPTGSLATDLQGITPRVLLVSTTTTSN